MQQEKLVGAVEAMLFAHGEPMDAKDIEKVIERAWVQDDEDMQTGARAQVRSALEALKEKWQPRPNDVRGFELVEIAGGFVFRTSPIFRDVVTAMYQQRPVRLSRAALETLSIVAYRQPVTKPETDHIRGVDCGGTLRLLLDRGLVRIVGKKEEPGLPLLYGTTDAFLSFFNIASLNELPSLKEFHELSEESQEELDAFESQVSLDELSKSAKTISRQDEPAARELETAIDTLKTTQKQTRNSLASQGIRLEEEKDAPLTNAESSEKQAAAGNQLGENSKPHVEDAAPTETTG